MHTRKKRPHFLFIVTFYPVSHLSILTLSYISVECVCVCRWTKEKGLSCQFPSGSARDTVYSWAKTCLFTANIQCCRVGMTQNGSFGRLLQFRFSTYHLTLLRLMSNQKWKMGQILWPFQKIWTLSKNRGRNIFVLSWKQFLVKMFLLEISFSSKRSTIL